MKKIVIVTDAWHPQVNGAVTVLARMVEELHMRGIKTVLIHPGLFHTFPMPGYPEIPLAILPYRAIRRMLLEAHADAIHITTEGPIGLAARRACIRKKIPFTTSYHTHFHLYVGARYYGFTWLAYNYLRWFHSAAVKTMVATPSLKEELEKAEFRNLVLWPLGVDTELFQKTEVYSKLPGPVFAYCGRLAVEKNVDEFLALSLPGSKLVIGDGPLRAHLSRAHPKAKFVGYQRGGDLVGWLSQANVLVFPSRTETFGLVVIEALACGVPVVAHEVMGPKDIITDGVDGYLGENLGELAKKALVLDKSKCREKALQYTWARSAEMFLGNLVSSESPATR